MQTLLSSTSSERLRTLFFLGNGLLLDSFQPRNLGRQWLMGWHCLAKQSSKKEGRKKAKTHTSSQTDTQNVFT